jgi:phosphatidylserine decarboxylase
MVAHTAAGLALALALTLPLAWKWQLGVRRVAAAVTVLALGAGLLVWLLDANLLLRSLLVAVLTLVAAAAVLAYRFYRDPERTAPAMSERAIVSPADGEVVYVRESRGGRLPVSTKGSRDYALTELTKTTLRSDDAIVIGISMSFLDVHVNRAPIAGRITVQRHFAGLFGSLRRPEMVFENERATTVIERGPLQVAVVQIASRLVRQIVSYVREGDEVAVGQRIGVIRLGSQVDVVVPTTADLELLVRTGDRVRAGESVLAQLRAEAGSANRSDASPAAGPSTRQPSPSGVT